MQFFTMTWWQGESDDDPFPLYDAHLATIRDQIPSQLRQLDQADPYSLHDALLREMHFDAARAELNLLLDVEDGQLDWRRLRLTYQKVTSFQSHADPNVGLGGPHGYGHLGYTEIHLVPDGHLEHRLLFSTGIELRIRFADFSFTVGEKIATPSPSKQKRIH